MTNKQFTTIKNNYELTFDSNSLIFPCEDSADIKAYSFNFVKIADLVGVEVGHMVDIVGEKHIDIEIVSFTIVLSLLPVSEFIFYFCLIFIFIFISL